MKYYKIARMLYNMGGRKYINWFLTKIDTKDQFRKPVMILGDTFFKAKKK